MIGAICYKITSEYEANIYLFGSYDKIDWMKAYPCELGPDFVSYEYKSAADIGVIFITDSVDGKKILRLVETERYILKVVSKDEKPYIIPQFQNEKNKFLKVDKDSDSIAFQFINYLGRTKILFPSEIENKELNIEIVPNKMDYEEDYIRLTEAIAQKCSELLLEHSGSTSNLYSLTERTGKTLLEQFIFLRQFCYSNNLRSLFESIKRNPDRILSCEDNLEQMGKGAPSRDFYKNPFSNSRGWKGVSRADGKRVYIPQEVSITRKIDSLDTPANRFLKYALQTFDEICILLMRTISTGNAVGSQEECVREATKIHKMLTDIFSDRFFDEIGELNVLPQNNQVLQKREGYSQIFAAYSMIDLALQLDWKGKDEIYEGESKNVALLYEYWLFFELYKAISSIEGCRQISVGKEDFITYTDGGVTISLEEGKHSRQAFVIDRFHTKINLYYNRTFSKKEFQSTLYEGSYSRPFRPDYTLAIFSDVYSSDGNNGEDEAIRNGAVSYVHFDAKYRITDITSIIGNNTNENEIIEDKSDAIVNTYKRGDLLKMHTYNDAIRRTIGSYVLYPGRDDFSGKTDVEYRLYDEILPGVGAFAIRPSIDELGEQELRRFIIRLVEAKGLSNSRLNRMRHYVEMVLREPAIPELTQAVAIKNTNSNKREKGRQCVIGYVKADSPDDYYHSLLDNHLLEVGKEFLFYFYAIKEDHIYSHHQDLFRTDDFCFYKNCTNDDYEYCLEPILGKIQSNELVSKKELVARLNKQGFNTVESNHNADFYYVLRVKVVRTDLNRMRLDTAFINSINGNDTFSAHSPKVVSWSDIEK